MSVDPLMIAENTATRERLRSLLASTNDEELARPLGDGRTIATILGHVAFWDQRILVLLERWSRGDVMPSPSDTEPDDVDWINDAVQPFFLAMPPRVLADLALHTAEQVDNQVSTFRLNLWPRYMLREIPSASTASLIAASISTRSSICFRRDSELPSRLRSCDGERFWSNDQRQ